MERKLSAEETDKTAYAVGIILEFSSMLLNGEMAGFTDETFRLVADSEKYITKNYSPAEQIELFAQAAVISGGVN